MPISERGLRNAAMTQNEWFYRIDGEITGPVTARALKTLAALGDLLPTHKVRNGVEGNWQLAKFVQGLQFGSPPKDKSLQPQSAGAAQAELVHKYKMVQVPRNIIVQQEEHKGNEAAAYLEGVVNQYAREGWEFYRVDTIGVKLLPGCLGLLFGKREETVFYYVITFRKRESKRREEKRLERCNRHAL